MTVSGHKSEASISSFSRTSDRKKKEMSAALSSLMPAEPSQQVDESQPSTSRPSTEGPGPDLGLGVPVENVVVYDPSTNAVTSPPLIVEPQPDAVPEPQMDRSFNLDLVIEDSFLLSSSQEEIVL